MNKLLYIYLICLFIFTTASAQDGISFRELEWTEALEKSAEENKLVFVSAYVDWSEPCEEIEKYTYSDKEVGEYFNENFINIRLDMEAFPGVELTEYYNIYGFPALLFVDETGTAVHRGCGALETGELIALGKEALSDQRLIDYRKKFEQGERSTAFLVDYSYKLETACMSTDRFVADYFKSVPQKEWVNEPSWTMINLNITDPYSDQFQYLMSYHDMFALRYGKDTVDQKIYNVLLSQFISIYDQEDFTLFAIQALRSLVSKLDFNQQGELSSLVNLQYADLKEDWPLYAESVLKVIEEQEVTDPEQLNEFAWKFYLFVDDQGQLSQAKDWMKKVLSDYPDATYHDTYASLLFKLGDQKGAVKYAERALQAAEIEQQDLMHYEAQLQKFKGGY